MAATKILSILLVCVFASQAWTKPVNHFKDFDVCKLKATYEALAPSESDKKLTPTVQLMKVMMFDLQDLALRYVKEAKDISDKVLKDSIFTTNTSPEVLKFKKEIEEFESKYTTCAEMEQLFDLVDLYSNATADYYEEEAKGTLSSNSKVVLDVLKKYSPKNIDDEFEKIFLDTFVVNFGQKINEVKEGLKKEEGGMGEKVLKWWDDVKSLKTVDEKIEAFKEYMKLYGFDDEEEKKQ